MALGIADFIGHIKRNNVARANRFDIVFNLPTTLVDYLNQGDEASTIGSYSSTIKSGNRSPVSAERMMSLSCLGTAIPAVGANTSEIDYGNYSRRIASDRNVNDFHTSFIITGNFIEKKIFDAWQDIIFKQDRHRVEYYDNYITSLTVTCYDVAGNQVYQFELTDAYPVTVGEIQLDRTSQNTQMILDIQWAFHKIKHGSNDYDAKILVGSDSKNYIAPTINQIQGTTAVVGSPVASSSILQAKELRDAVNRGDVSKGAALKIAKKMILSFKSAKDMPDSDKTVVSGHLDDLEASLDDNETIVEVPYE